MKKSIALLFLLLLIGIAPVQAYIGPGAGIPVLGSLLGLLATVVLAIAAILFWPIRKLLKRKKAARAAQTDDNRSPEESPQ
ncbi:MAG: hypothetical protein V2J55_12180 [Candidatus Competibacteraceae bacterium]|jgi:hypothetical protein|nr:hypothetical protein [Candidatus Competibacteraceae bacterium]